MPSGGGPEKREGTFCVWTASELRELLGEVLPGATGRASLADVAMHHYRVREQGNVEPEQGGAGGETWCWGVHVVLGSRCYCEA